MRKIILQVAVSLDGFIEGPNGEYDWCFTDQDYGLEAFCKRVDSIFVGRKTYEMSLGLEGGIEGFPKFKEYIFSTTLSKVKEGTSLIRGNIKEEVEKIKNESGKDIWLFGGASLTTSLIKLGFVDELSLAVHPILLGSGKPLFQNIDQRILLTLLNSKTYSSGLVMLSYAIGHHPDKMPPVVGH
jgi:dihydrofolate reductase